MERGWHHIDFPNNAIGNLQHEEISGCHIAEPQRLKRVKRATLRSFRAIQGYLYTLATMQDAHSGHIKLAGVALNG